MSDSAFLSDDTCFPNYRNHSVSIESIILRARGLRAEEMAERGMPRFRKIHASTIPDFDGKSDELKFFIDCVDNVVDHFFDTFDETNYQNDMIFRTILSKLKGPARKIIHISCPTTIGDLKTELIRKFSDPRNEYQLLYDLYAIKQENNETPIEFYDRLRVLLSKMSNYISFNEKNSVIGTLKKQLYKEQGLQIFLTGLKNPYGMMLRMKEPKTLFEAINFIKKEETIKQVQQQLFGNEFFDSNPFENINRTEENQVPKLHVINRKRLITPQQLLPTHTRRYENTFGQALNSNLNQNKNLFQFDPSLNVDESNATSSQKSPQSSSKMGV